MSRVGLLVVALASAVSLASCLLDPNGRWACDPVTGQDCVDAGVPEVDGGAGDAGDAGDVADAGAVADAGVDAGSAPPVVTLGDAGAGAALFGSSQSGLALTGDGQTVFGTGTWADGGVFVVEVQRTDAGLTPRAFISHGLPFWGPPGDEWGAALAVTPDGQRLAVGARSGASADGGADRPGAVHLFVRDGGGWWEEARVEPLHGARNLNYGMALSFSADGTRLAIGSDAWAPLAGVVEVWTRAGSAWSREVELSGVSGDHFGFDVALDAAGGLLVVGAPTAPGDAGFQAPGAVSAYRRSGATWALAQQLAPAPTSTTGRFGASVELSASGQVLVVGEPSFFTTAPGAVSFLDAADGGFSLKSRIAGAAKDHLGQTLALSADGTRLAATVLANDGRVDFYSSLGGWHLQGALLPTVELGPFPFESLALSADGTVLATPQVDSQNQGTLLLVGP